MKQVIKLVKQAAIELVVAGIILAVFWGVFMRQLSQQSKVADTVKSKSNQELLEKGFPAITVAKTKNGSRNWKLSECAYICKSRRSGRWGLNGSNQNLSCDRRRREREKDSV